MSESSISPMAHRPRSLSPSGRKPQNEPSQVITYSPLRTEQSVNGLARRTVQIKAESPRSKFAPSVEGFPFHPLETTRQTSDLKSVNETAPPPLSVITKPAQKRDASAAGEEHQNLVSEPLKKSNLAGNSTPTGRRSVQFVRPSASTEQPEVLPSKLDALDDEGGDQGRDRRAGGIFSKLRALAGSSSNHSHTRSSSGPTVSGDSADERFTSEGVFPYSESREPRFGRTSEEVESDVDADGEQSTGEDNIEDPASRRKRRKSRRPEDGGVQTAPTTPKTPFMRDRPGFFSSNTQTSTRNRPYHLPRRATMPDVPGESGQGVSEDEGRDRLERASPWRRGSAWVHGSRGVGYTGARKPIEQPTGEGPRPSNFRRFTGFGGSGDGPDAASSPFSPWKLRSERTSSISAAKWKQIKAGLKLIGQKRKAESTIDHAKSAELLAELTAGVPAALLLASMFQRDDHGNKRVPILLEQLKVRLTDSKHVDTKAGDHHMIFRIEMEYGNGLTRMKWVIHRALRDFSKLHAKYKVQISTQKYIQLKGHNARTKLPHFPRSAFPYLRGIRGLDSESEGEEEPEVDGAGTNGGDVSGTDRLGKRRKRRPSLSIMHRKSSVAEPTVGDAAVGVTAAAAGGVAGAVAGASARKDPYAERQRRKLELYLQQMIRYLIFRPESNRLCKFLELSALGVRLAAEGSYHGKEGLLAIQSGKGVDFRRAWTPSLVRSRHGWKWFLVRHSYIVCVDSPEEMNIYDVFLVDSEFEIQANRRRLRDQKKPKDLARTAQETAAHPKYHTLKLCNSERKVRLRARNERQLHQFEESISFMSHNTPWAEQNRFNSFAPVRPKVFAQWLVDGRDYMWNVSRAISMAKDVVYIHDWWLSPELYMRRPAAISQKWRLDRLLQRKASEGVKVFVIVYRNIESAIPIDSEYTKFSLLDLHPNVFVQRSPNQIRQGTFFWAHHEKICVVDHMVAFVGGIDLCFGRWDTPQHTVVDDKLTGFEVSDMPKDADHCQLWAGKDYSNPRVQDFYALDKPYEEMYDRSKVPRMPWHDISMQVVGQPARDLTRHFVQRWNYILRQRKPTRPTPFLLPPPDFNPADLEALGLDGTCEVQILRSCCEWSMGTPGRVEHSILDAYSKLIEKSEYFVYIENQFFVSSCEVEGTRIENTIGDALVERIIRASQKGEDWRAIVVIPLMPGFQNTVDSQDGTSVRLIMQCQFRSICRGKTSIFGRLRAHQIEPEDYIQFYSLRSWGKIGPTKQLVTEQLYIHAKCMVVDDKTAIIGSANINERSMLGSRDSECAAVVRDTDMLWSTMNGEPYLVGRFPHTLRVRLMREHLGLDVDCIMEGEQHEREGHINGQWEREMDGFHGGDNESNVSNADRETEHQILESKHKMQDELLAKSENLFSFDHDIDWEQADNPNLKSTKKMTQDYRITGNSMHHKDVEGEGTDHMVEQEALGVASGRDSKLENDSREVLVSSNEAKSHRTLFLSNKDASPERPLIRDSKDVKTSFPPFPPKNPRMTTAQLGLPMLSQLPALPKTDDRDIGGPSTQHVFSKKNGDVINPLIAEMKRPFVDQDCMRDPLNDSFYLDTWQAVAENNTKLFRTVFRCMPDNEVKTWKEYKEYAAYTERFAQAQGASKSKDRIQQEAPGSSGPPGQANIADKLRTLGSTGEKGGDVGNFGEKLMHTISPKNYNNNHLMGRVEDWAEEATKAQADRQSRDIKEEGSDHREGAGNDDSIDEKASHKPIHGVQPETVPTSHDTEKQHEAKPITSVEYSEAPITNSATQKQRRRRTTTRSSRREFQASDDMINPKEGEELCKMVQGHLVVWPYDWSVLLMSLPTVSSKIEILILGQ